MEPPCLRYSDSMSAVYPPPRPVFNAPFHPVHVGPLEWRKLVEWLSEDGVIDAQEAQRTITRCAQVQSAQHPLVRLASVSMTRLADGKPLDLDTITQWLAGRAKRTAAPTQPAPALAD